MLAQILELCACSKKTQKDAAETIKGLEDQIERMDAAKEEDTQKEAAVLEDAYNRCPAIP